MLLLLTTLALAQDPAPEGGASDAEQPAPSQAPADPVPSEAPSDPAEETPAETPPEIPPETPAETPAETAPESEGWSGETDAAQATPEPAQPQAVDPSLWGSYEEGYEAGALAAEELADWFQPAVAGAGVGAGAAGLGVVCGGLVCGAPAVLGGAGYQAYKTRKDVPAPPPGAWQDRSAEFQTGFIQGFQARANQKRTRWALAGGATGAVVGAGVGLVVVAVLYDRQGRDFI